MINQEIGGIMKVDEAIKQKKLFILDYHDCYYHLFTKLESLKEQLYMDQGQSFPKPRWNFEAISYRVNSTTTLGFASLEPSFLTLLAFNGGLAMETSLKFMSLPMILAIINLLKTHSITEPYVIATNRQLSIMHPVHRLLHPHFRYTMEINALAREALINAESLVLLHMIRNGDSIYKHCRPILLIRGMAVEDPNSPLV
ncbi:hypothetical protein F8388_013223 [Cannabis sativa]|uniref:Lipoxygenase domain-containing protein n=1 Tax=Cannabis sativa TaxID=3483 RepID=A0A7J6ED38_CANSA|nr:hypothetical protein F8388_013223 [Cannabis sativa]